MDDFFDQSIDSILSERESSENQLNEINLITLNKNKSDTITNSSEKLNPFEESELITISNTNYEQTKSASIEKNFDLISLNEPNIINDKSAESSLNNESNSNEESNLSKESTEPILIRELNESNLNEVSILNQELTISNKESNSNKELTISHSNEESNLNKESTILNQESNSNKELNSNKESTIQNSSEESNSNKLSCTNLLNLNNSNNWIFEFNWDINNQLIQLLNKFIRSLLINNITNFDNDLELMLNNSQLIKKLTNLPLKLDQLDSDKSTGLIINLNNEFRHKIMNQLLKNEYVVLKLNDLVDETSKNELIKENKQLIFELIKLPAEYKLNNDKCSTNKKRKYHFIQTDNEDDTPSDLKNEIKLLKKEIVYLKKSIENTIGYRFSCELRDAKNFFEKDNIFNSEKFDYLDIEFRISVESKFVTDSNENKRYFGFYLQAKNDKDDQRNVNWQLNSSFELRLKNNLPNKLDKIRKFNYVWMKSKGHGYNKFLSVDELFDLNNGFIRNNLINLEVHLKGDKVLRDI